MKLLIWKDMAASCGFFSKHPLHTPVWRIVIQERERVNNKLAKNWKGFYLAMPPSGALWTTAQISISGTFLKKFWTSLLTEFGEGAASSSSALAGRKSNFPLCQQAFNLCSYYQLHTCCIHQYRYYHAFLRNEISQVLNN